MTARLVTRVKKNDDTNFPPFPNPPPRGFLKFSSPYSFNSKYYWANFRIIPQPECLKGILGEIPLLFTTISGDQPAEVPRVVFFGGSQKAPTCRFKGDVPFNSAVSSAEDPRISVVVGEQWVFSWKKSRHVWNCMCNFCICIYIYIYVYIYMYIYVYVYIYVYICVYKFIYMYIYVYICVYKCIYIYMCVYIYIYFSYIIYVCVCKNVYVYVNIYISVYIESTLYACFLFQCEKHQNHLHL